VDFFVKAAEEQARTGQFVTRDFVGAATFARQERGVVYAVPKGHEVNEVDRAFQARLAKILADYKTRREKFIGEEKAGVVALLRDWFCRENQCFAPALQDGVNGLQ
jgi:hypothetical protein